MSRGRRGEDPWGLLCSSRPGRCLLWLCPARSPVLLLARLISGRRVACPPARRPRCELRSARRLEARPGPAGPAAASNRAGLVAVSGPPWPCRRPRAPQPHHSYSADPPAPSTPAAPVGPAWPLLSNFARNSPESVSGFEMGSLIFRGF